MIIRYPKGRHLKGFTLIELMVTIAVLGVLLGLGVPAFGRLIAANRMATQTNEFNAGLQLARSEAIRRGQSVAMRSMAGDLGFETGWRVFTDSDSDGAAPTAVTSTNGTVIRENAAISGSTTIHRVTRSGSPGSYTYTNSTADDRMFVVFNSRGANNQGTQTFFKVCDSRNTSISGRIIQISLVGKISLDSTNESCT
jgi:type IV fimbrial biogenesis protein FimT